MNVLALDTSTDCLSVALAVGSEIQTLAYPGLRQHADRVLPMIEQLLAEAALSCQQLDAIVYGRGPGSFTGLRIACSVAQGLGFAHDKPLYPVSGLAAMAWDALGEGASVLALIDARMQQVYWGYFTGVSFEVAEQVSSPDAVRVHATNPVKIVGVGLEGYEDVLRQTIVAPMVMVRAATPSAGTLIRLVQAGHVQPIAAADARPVYIRDQVTGGVSGG